MPPIIHIIHQIIDVIVKGEILGVIERHLLPIFLTVGGMIRQFVEYSMGDHRFGNKPVFYGAVYVERYSPHIMPQSFN